MTTLADLAAHKVTFRDEPNVVEKPTVWGVPRRTRLLLRVLLANPGATLTQLGEAIGAPSSVRVHLTRLIVRGYATEQDGVPQAIRDESGHLLLPPR